jgi:FHS family L-fucose permease-like MFS transporter
MLSYGLITFTVARFVSPPLKIRHSISSDRLQIGTALLSVIAAPVLLALYAAAALVCSILIGTLPGMGAVIFAIVIMFFESIMYPVIFVLGTTGLGRHTRRAAALLVMGVAGGAVWPPIQGAIADAYGTQRSYFIVVPNFLYVTIWAIWVWHKDGRRWTVAASEVEREIEAAAGGAIPPAAVGLNYRGSQADLGYAGKEIKEDLRAVEKV